MLFVLTVKDLPVLVLRSPSIVPKLQKKVRKLSPLSSFSGVSPSPVERPICNVTAKVPKEIMLSAELTMEV